MEYEIDDNQIIYVCITFFFSLDYLLSIAGLSICGIVQVIYEIKTYYIKRSMGEVAGKICGGGSPLEWLIKNYGDDIGRVIAIEKVKQLLDVKVTETKSTIGKESTNVLKQVEGTIDGKKTQLSNTFQNYKQMINDKIPGGVGSLEKLRGDSIENILGLNEFTKKFDEVKNTANTKFNEEQQKVFATIDQTGQQQKQLLNSQRPKVPLYDNMSQGQQKIVFKEGEKMFAKQIKQQEESVMKEIGDKLNPQTYLNSFKNIVPVSSLDGLLGSATSQFEDVKKMLTGGGFGNVVPGIGSIF